MCAVTPDVVRVHQGPGETRMYHPDQSSLEAKSLGTGRANNLDLVENMVTIHMSKRRSEQAFCTRTIDIHQPNFQHRLTYLERQDIAVVFAPDLAKALIQMLEDASNKNGYLNEPDFVLSLRNGILGRLKVATRANKKGDVSAIIKIAYFIGDPESLLRSGAPAEQIFLNARDRTDIDALMDICLPAVGNLRMNLLQKADATGHFIPQEERASPDDRAVSELQFYVYLLQRFVQNSIDYCKIKDTYSIEEMIHSPINKTG